MRRVLPITLLLFASATLVPTAQQTTRPPAQQPGLTFRATANFVEVDAIVTDANGDPAPDLTCEDFRVIEDGKPQNLSVCAFVNIPIDRPDPPLFRDRIIEPDVTTNEKAFDGRIFMIVLDGFHVSASRGIHVRREAEKFIDKYMGENDIAAVVQVGNPGAGQEFTSNKRLLKASVQRFAGQSLPSITASINADALVKLNQTFEGFDAGAAVDTDAQVREYMARQSMDTIRKLSEYMGELSGRRKAVLFFSEGIGINYLQPIQLVCEGCPAPPNLEPVRMSQRDMISAASKSNVSIYSIDPRGLTSGTEEMVMISGLASAPEEGSTLRDYSNPNIMSDNQNEVTRSQDSLREFAESTGGLAMVNKNDMDDAFRRIVKDNSSYYVLGYQSPDPRHDGRFHRIKVEVKRPGLRVRTRNGYYAPTDKKTSIKPPDPVVQLLRSPAPVGGLGIRANASIIKGLMQKSTVHMTLEFNGTDFPLKPSGGLFTNEITIEYMALDMKGVSQAGGREIAKLQLRPASKDALPETGVRAVVEFDLAPGRYQLRVAAQEKLTGRKGSVFSDLEVPDLATVRLGMSDLLITNSSALKTPTPNNTSTIGKLLPTPTTTSRVFSSADTLSVASSIYDNDTRAPHRVDLKATVHSDSGAQLFLKEDVKESATMTGAKGGSSWVLEIPLKGMAPGRYVLTVEANSRLKEVDPVRKEVEFTIK